MSHAPIDWRTRFRQGKFRGVEFFTDSHDFQGGRRRQIHEFPQRDEGRSEDLGRRLRRFNLDLLVIGDDYFKQRDKLIEALETEGPAVLIHPYLGRKTVQAGSFSLRETVQEGRVARFTVDFAEAGVIIFPESLIDALSETVIGAGELINEGQNAFEVAFDVANQTAFVIQAAANDLAAAADFLSDSVAKFTAPLADLAFAIRNFKDDLNRLINLPGELADRIAANFQLLTDSLSDDPDTRQKILGNFQTLDDEFEVIPGDTPSRDRQRTNRQATINYNKQVAIANEAISATEIDFGSIREAVEVRDFVAGRIDEQLEIIADDDLFQAARDLKASIVDALPAQGTSDIVTFTPLVTTPALVLAYNLFEDIEKELDIINENDIRHPGFVPGGDEIEVSGV